MKSTIIVLCLSLCLFKIQAQNSFEHRLGTWYMLNGDHELSENWSLKSAAHYRYFNFITDYQQELYRLGVNYKFSEHTNATFGSVYSITDPSYNEDGPLQYEFRFYQDLNLKDRLSIFNVTHRFRLAQRFKTFDAIKNIIHRIRYGLFLSYPVSEKLSIYSFNEIFFNIRSDAFDQNRTGIGMIHKVSEKLSFRIGYFHTIFSDIETDRLQIGAIIHTTKNNKSINKT